jgi:predicted amidohydrolase YtcJ
MISPAFRSTCGCLALVLATGCRVERRLPAVGADLVLRGALVWTADEEHPLAEAVAIHDGVLTYVGDAGGVERFIGTGTEVLDLRGRMVLPGFQDSHAHPVSAGLELGECNLYEAETVADIERTVRDYVVAHPDLPWIRGNGWALPIFPQADPSRELLDRLVPDRPAFFYAADGHSAWVNTRALELAGITRATPDPEGGRIERDPRTGEPSGTLREEAMALVASRLPSYSAEERLDAARRALREANRFGITAITDADVGDETLEAYAELSRRGELSARVTVALASEVDAPVAEEVERLKAIRDRYRRLPRLTVNTVKFYTDGVIEARTAALLAPYLDRPGDVGALVYQPDDLAERVVALDREGFQIHFHAIGDRAIRVSFDAIAAARRANGGRDRRPVLAHIELFDPSDIPRFRELGAIASFQPYWAQADAYIRDLTIPALGPARSRWLYPIQSVVNSGAVVAGGSDWSVSSLNPLDAIEVAITRRGARDSAGPAWIPEERTTLPTMLAAYTINAAYATYHERESGSLKVGKQADLIVVDRDLFSVPVPQLNESRVLLTLLDGREVWRDSTFHAVVRPRS